jgi:ABC-type lipoprotein release transport system permease subunit
MMAKRSSFLAFVFGSLARRRAKALALGGGLAFAVALVAAVLFLTDALRGEADRVRSAMPDVVVQRLVGGRPSVVRSADTAVVADPPIPSVASVRARVWGYVFLPALQGNIVIVGIAKGAPSLDDVHGALSEGRDLREGAHEMLAGATLARFLGLRLGDELGLPTTQPSTPLKLVGTFSSAAELYAADVLFCDERDARTLLSLGPDEATDLAVTLANSDESRVVARTVLDRFAAQGTTARVVERELLGRVYALGYGRRSGLVLAASIPALLALLVLAWDRASGLGPEEKREIAILKAVGWSTADVLRAKLLEATAIGALATAAGLLLAYAWVFWLGAPGLRPALVGWSVLYPEAPLTPMVDVAQLLGIALGVLAPFVSLSIVPAWRAATLDPMDAMRG